MATKKEIKQFLKDTGYTEEDMINFWNECIETNPTIRSLDRSGVTWDKMNINVIEKLPTQKERDLKYMEDLKEKERLDKEKREKEEQDKKYYHEHFEEIMVDKIDKNIDLTEEELKNIIWRYEVETSYGENRRWTRSVSSVVKMCDRFFMVDWEEGLTEYQENEYWDQPYEVEKKEYEKVIKVVEWSRK